MKILKNVVRYLNSGRYNCRVFLGYPLGYFDKIVGRASKNIGWQK
jgi:hypothetical protein